MTVLKGAAAAALYGTRAANGVIVITTKSGTNKLSKKDWKLRTIRHTRPRKSRAILIFKTNMARVRSRSTPMPTEPGGPHSAKAAPTTRRAVGPILPHPSTPFQFGLATTPTPPTTLHWLHNTACARRKRGVSSISRQREKFLSHGECLRKLGQYHGWRPQSKHYIGDFAYRPTELFPGRVLNEPTSAWAEIPPSTTALSLEPT